MSSKPDCGEAWSNLSQSLDRLAATATDFARGKLDGAADAMQAERKRRIWVTVSAAALLLWASTGALFAGVAIVAAFWDTHRVLATALVAAGFFVLAAAAFWVLYRKWRQRPTAFEWIAGILATVAQFRRPR